MLCLYTVRIYIFAHVCPYSLTHGYMTDTKRISATSIYFESMPYKLNVSVFRLSAAQPAGVPEQDASPRWWCSLMTCICIHHHHHHRQGLVSALVSAVSLAHPPCCLCRSPKRVWLITSSWRVRHVSSDPSSSSRGPAPTPASSTTRAWRRSPSTLHSVLDFLVYSKKNYR